MKSYRVSGDAPLRIVRLRPRATGDRAQPSPRAGPGEWVSVENASSTPIDLAGIYLCRLLGDSPEQWEVIAELGGEIPPGEAVAVHTGWGFDERHTRVADVLAAEHHLFAKREAYVWETKGGEVVALWKESDCLDYAVTEPSPVSAVLERSADRLVAPSRR